MPAEVEVASVVEMEVEVMVEDSLEAGMAGAGKAEAVAEEWMVLVEMAEGRAVAAREVAAKAAVMATEAPEEVADEESCSLERWRSGVLVELAELPQQPNRGVQP